MEVTLKGAKVHEKQYFWLGKQYEVYISGVGFRYNLQWYLHILLQTVKELLGERITHQRKLIVSSKPKLRTHSLFNVNHKT